MTPAKFAESSEMGELTHVITLAIQEENAIKAKMPISLYLKLKPFLGFRFLGTYIEQGESFKIRLPDWAWFPMPATKLPIGIVFDPETRNIEAWKTG